MKPEYQQFNYYIGIIEEVQFQLMFHLLWFFITLNVKCIIYSL